MISILKVVTLTITMLVFADSLSFAAPPGPPGPTPKPTPKLNPCLTIPCPDLVPWKGGMGGGIGVKQFTCSSTQTEPYVLKIVLGIKNTGNVGTTVGVKTLAKINGVVWNNPNNPHVTAPMAPNQWQEFSMNGAVPGPGTYNLSAKVDSDNQQVESNETNNETTATAICR